MCKMVISTGVFFIFKIFWLFGLIGGGGLRVGKRAKNSAKWKWKLHPSHAISQEQYGIWSWFVVHFCKMIFWSFFHFLKILTFPSFSGVKGQKMAQNNKKFCLSCSISQEPYIIWMSSMLHMCKMITAPGVFFIFSKFWFSKLLEG